MSEFKFNCPHCGQPLEAPEDMWGQIVDCPTCHGRITIPQPEPTVPPIPQPSPADTSIAPVPIPSLARAPLLREKRRLLVTGVSGAVVLDPEVISAFLKKLELKDPDALEAAAKSLRDLTERKIGPYGGESPSELAEDVHIWQGCSPNVLK